VVCLGLKLVCGKRRKERCRGETRSFHSIWGGGVIQGRSNHTFFPFIRGFGYSGKERFTERRFVPREGIIG
jgi:hypothetical protein